MTPEERFEMIVGKLEVVHREGYYAKAICPAHADDKASLSVRLGERLVSINCFAGCTGRNIMYAIGLNLSHLYYAQTPPDKTKDVRADGVTKEEVRKSLQREIFPEVEDYSKWTYNENMELDERLAHYCRCYDEMTKVLPGRSVRLNVTWIRLYALLQAVFWYHDLNMHFNKKADERLIACDKTALRQLAQVGIIKSAVFPKVVHNVVLDEYLKVCSRGIWVWETGQFKK